ncbi:AMP-binding protein [Aquicoccus sp. SCR17]|nr:AMP-binding protein [Carideicomes alvinocaridis]
MPNPLYDTLLGRHATRETTFLHLPDGGSVSYAEFHRMAGRQAAAIRELGLQPGDRVAAQVGKSAEALALFFACARGGFVFLPLNTGYTPEEVAYFVENSGARLFLCDPASEAALAPVADASGALLEALREGGGSFADRAAGQDAEFPIVDREAGDLAAFLYTSGTTGRSKGAMLSQENLLSNAEVLAEYWRFTDSDVLLHALPIFHTHGLFVATNTVMLAGGSMILLPKFELDAVIAALPRATSMMGVPTFYTRLLSDPRFDRDLVGHMRLFTSGSAPMLEETHHQFETRTGQRILERYGMTETNMSTSNPYEGERRAGTVGFPLPGVELKICDADGREVAQGEIGTIEVRGANVFQGYWGMPEKTAEELRPDGFFITGDLAQMDADGYVTIVGRGKDLIISGGFNIYPKELEQELDEMPGVLESAVVGAPHPDFGESPVGVLVPLPGETPDLDAIRAALREKLASFKQPKELVVIEELPRNTMGKVQKAELRARYKDIFGG